MKDYDISRHRNTQVLKHLFYSLIFMVCFKFIARLQA